MTAQEYITIKLKELPKTGILFKPTKEELVDVIFRIVTTKKFRKYSATPELLTTVKDTIRLNIANNEPISFVSSHGVYKLWRLEEAPEADWAELFAFMYYTTWLKAICEIYEPGVWFDFYTDDLLIPKINNIALEDVRAYQASYQKTLDFLKGFQLPNFRMTMTTVGSHFASADVFYEKLEKDTKRLASELPGGLPNLDDKRIATLELNSHASDEQKLDPLWREKIALIHDAYLAYTKPEMGYHFNPHKILVFTTPLASKKWLSVGTTKDSIAKFWIGVGALKPADNNYRQIILTPNQLSTAKYSWEDIHLESLTGKNFSKIRVLK